MQLTKRLTSLEILEKLFSDKFLSDYFLNADATIFHDIIREDILSALLEAKPAHEQSIIVKKYKTSHVIKTILSNLYDDLIAGKRKAFPPGTFKGLQGNINSAILFKYVFADRLQWNLRKIIMEVDKKTLYQHKLRCVFQGHTNIYELVREAFPEQKVKPYYFAKVRNIWRDKNGILNEKLIKEAITEFVGILTDVRGKYKYNIKQLPQWIRYQHFQENILPYGANISYLLESCFGNSPARAIMFAFPELKLQPHYFSNVPKGYWKNKDNVEKVKIELLDALTSPHGRFQFTDEELKQFLSSSFYQNPLFPYRKKARGLLKQGLGNNPLGLLQHNVFKR